MPPACLPTCCSALPRRPCRNSALQRPSGWLRKRKRLLASLAPTEEELFATTVDSNRRNMIRKAQKAGITAQEATAADLPAFEALLRATYERCGHHAAARKLAGSEVLATLGPIGQAGLLLAHTDAGEVMSGLFFLGNRHMMHYWLGASSYDHKNMGQNELLQYTAMCKAKALGTAQWDLCVYEPDKLPGHCRLQIWVQPHHRALLLLAEEARHLRADQQTAQSRFQIK